jgi:alpha-galactosidase
MLLLGLLAAGASATNDGFPNSLGSTPLRGVRTWNSVREEINQTFVASLVEGLLAPIAGDAALTLISAGYSDVGVDDGWELCGAGVNGSYHDPQGRPIVNASRFPDFAALSAYARASNVTTSWYGNACGCSKGEHALSQPHYEQDAAALVQYGFSGLKVDGCGNEPNMTAWAAALNATGVPLLLENCNDGSPFRPTKRPDGSIDCPYNLFRTSIDGAPNFRSTMWNVLQTLPFLEVSSPGCFAYSDMLTIGSPVAAMFDNPAFVENCGGKRLSQAEARAQFSAFAVLSSPLVLGFDVGNATERALWGPIVTHGPTLAINAAWDGEAGRLVARSPDNHWVSLAVGGICELMQNYSMPDWMVVGKRLSSTPEGVTTAFAAVVLVGDWASPINFSASLEGMGFPKGALVRSCDGWTSEDTGSVTDQWEGQGVLAPGGLYRIFSAP